MGPCNSRGTSFLFGSGGFRQEPILARVLCGSLGKCYENLGVTRFCDLNTKAKQFLKDLRESTGVPIRFGFTGRDNASVVTDVESGLWRGCASVNNGQSVVAIGSAHVIVA